MRHHLGALFDAIAATRDEKPAIFYDDRAISWKLAEDRASRLASVLSRAGVGLGDVVGICLPNRPEYIEAMWASYKLGAIPININYRYTSSELDHLARDSDMRALVFDGAYGDAVGGMREAARLVLALEVGDETAPATGGVGYETELSAAARHPGRTASPDERLLFYTGGTTGHPKGVVHSHGAFCALLARALDSRGIPGAQTLDEVPAMLRAASDRGFEPRAFPVSPLMHMAGLTSALTSLICGGGVILMSGSALDAGSILDRAAQHRATSVSIVGDVFARAIATELERRDAEGRAVELPFLQAILSSGAMWSRELKTRILAHLDVQLVDSIGSTEGGMGMSISTRGDVVDTGRFRPFPWTKIFDDEDREIPPGSPTPGRLAVSGFVPAGYHGDPEKSSRTFRPVGDTVYSFPGDYALHAPNGDFILLGRGGSCINTGGEKVFPEEVEEVLKRHPSVTDAAVVGLPDDQYGQRVVAVVSSAEPITLPELLAFARSDLAGYKVPKEIRQVEQVKRLVNGKLDYAWVRSAVEAARGD